jgi:hypothetical protein
MASRYGARITGDVMTREPIEAPLRDGRVQAHKADPQAIDVMEKVNVETERCPPGLLMEGSAIDEEPCRNHDGHDALRVRRHRAACAAGARRGPACAASFTGDPVGWKGRVPSAGR